MIIMKIVIYMTSYMHGNVIIHLIEYCCQVQEDCIIAIKTEGQYGKTND